METDLNTHTHTKKIYIYIHIYNIMKKRNKREYQKYRKPLDLKYLAVSIPLYFRERFLQFDSLEIHRTTQL